MGQVASPPSPQKLMFRTSCMSLNALATSHLLPTEKWGVPQPAGLGLAALTSEGALPCAHDQTLMLLDFHSMASGDHRSVSVRRLA